SGTLALLLAAVAAAGGESAYYRVDLAPSGQIIATDLPVTKGTMVVFHRYPSGDLVSLRRTEVRGVVRIPPAAAEATRPSEAAVPIRNLAMQGGAPTSAPAARRPAGTAAPPPTASASPRWNGYDPWAVTSPGDIPPMELSSPANA